ncbi:type III secretion system LEE muramidase EtgA [Escherichia coli]|nr:type III secretion system LEE muramidase EtgA [Escherichia coli]ELK0083480.1 type III secretion system LEE muramidase EtgA [Escherichia coli]
MKKIILSIVLISNYCYASDCFEITGKAYNIDPLILKAIAWNESKCKSGIKSKTNKNGTYDIGIMQINSSHLDLLSKFNISEDDLLNDACINISVAGYILASNIKSRGNTWDAVGAYNAGYFNTPNAVELRRQYAMKIYKTYNKLKNNEQIID